MNTPVVVALIVVLALAIAVSVVILLKARRTQRLRSRFGPEYNRVVETIGSKRHGEAKLETLERRVQSYHIRPLAAAERSDYIQQWRRVQARFVDDPRTAVKEADRLIEIIMGARGYPMTEFEERAADISVDHPLVVEQYRAGHAIALRHAQGHASTEDLRLAMLHYRTLFEELVESAHARTKIA
jgi:hypothetical protein